MWCGGAGASCDARALEAHLLTQLARFKVPRDYVFVEACRATRWARCSISCCANGIAPDAHRGPRRRQRLVRGGGRHGARRPRGAAVAARRRGRESAQRGGRHHHREGFSRAARGEAVADHERHRGGGARCRTDPLPCPRDRAARHRPRARAASDATDRSSSCRPARSAPSSSQRPRTMPATAPTWRSPRPARLPWLTRKHGPFEVAITIRAKRLPTGVFPLTRKEHALASSAAHFPA